MKKLILSTIISGGYLMATAQVPDTARQQQWNNGSTDTTMQQQWNSGNRPDSITISTSTAPTEVAPAATVSPDTMSIAPSQPMNTDVRNTDPMADTVNMKTTAEPAVIENNTAVSPAETRTATDSTAAANTTVPVETAPVEASTVTEQSGSAAVLPRGVNIPEASTLTTGLGKWSALPVLNTFVPEEVVNKLKMEHGEKLYDITMLKTGENQYAYSARVQENGVYNTVILKGDTVAVNQ